jgi:putative Ca2+/H+ antiporter (TMEM165/GDT1 family)
VAQERACRLAEEREHEQADSPSIMDESMSAWSIFLSVFAVVFVAELPDKTALAALVLATRHRPAPVFLGAAAALTIQSGVAVGAGQLVSLLPERPVHVLAGLLFGVSAVVMWRREEDDDDSSAEDDRGDRGGFWRAAWTVFGVVFIAEWGDLTQLATAALAARYRAPWVVLASSALALWAVTGIAVFVGHHAGRLLDPNVTKRVAAVLFAAIGVALVAGLL